MYYSIGDYYRQRFGTRVIKVPVGVVDECPNRLGLKGMQTCTYCDIWGSAARESILTLPLNEQIEAVRSVKKTKYKNALFLIYFQSYTTTFSAVEALRRHFETALSFPDVCGIVIGTRPDCLSPSLLALFREFSKRTALFVELGVESFDETQLTFLRRGHTARQSVEAIRRLAEEVSVPLGIHLIFGLPGETDVDVINAAEEVARLPVHNVKLHHLHVLRKTHLEQLYNEGVYRPLDLSTYARRVTLFLRYLPSHVAVQRLAGLSSRWDDVVAPEWTKQKMFTYQYILNEMKQQGVQQGDRTFLCRAPSLTLSP